MNSKGVFILARTKTNEIFYQIINEAKSNNIEFYGNLLSKSLAHIKVDEDNPYYLLFKTIYLFQDNSLSTPYLRIITKIFSENITKRFLEYKTTYDITDSLKNIQNKIDESDFKNSFLFLFEITNVGYVLVELYNLSGKNKKLFKQNILNTRNNLIKFSFTSDIENAIAVYHEHFIDATESYQNDKTDPNSYKQRTYHVLNISKLFIFFYLYKILKSIDKIKEIKDIKIYEGRAIPYQIKYSGEFFGTMLDTFFNEFHEFDLEKNVNQIYSKDKNNGLKSTNTDLNYDYIFDITYNSDLTDNENKHYWLKISLVEKLNNNNIVKFIPITNAQTLLYASRNALKEKDSLEISDIFRERQIEDMDFILENFKKIFLKHTLDKNIEDEIIFHYSSSNLACGYFQAYNSFKSIKFHSYPQFILNIKYTKNDTLFNFDIINTHSPKRKNKTYKYLLKTNKEVYNRNIKIIRDIIKFFDSKKFKNHLKKTSKKYQPNQKLSKLAIEINKKIKERELSFDLFLTYIIYSFGDKIKEEIDEEIYIPF